ncbi:CocE/NonD family hydrolase [Paraburkholderia youngii]|uniref:CocE/NonD family hydrolase n=1 Tax=Paraburkholderia youngii TaxID=2782701 RepID=UPI0020D11B2A
MPCWTLRASRTGCCSVMDRAEHEATVSVTRWLTSDPVARGFDKLRKPVAATKPTGHLALEGISYNGTLPMMIAATDVPNLDAIVPVQGMSNGYDHFLTAASMRILIRLGPYMDQQEAAARTPICELTRFKAVADSDDVTYTYNDFW